MKASNPNDEAPQVVSSVDADALADRGFEFLFSISGKGEMAAPLPGPPPTTASRGEGDDAKNIHMGPICVFLTRIQEKKFLMPMCLPVLACPNLILTQGGTALCPGLKYFQPFGLRHWGRRRRIRADRKWSPRNAL
jgi:hypothetical protein